MTTSEAGNFGRAKILKATGLLTLLFLLAFMLSQTAGDFANGILFFIDALFNIHVLVILAILFSLTFVFGNMAGREIIIRKRNFLLVSLKYTVSIVLVLYIYIALVGVVKEGLPTKKISMLFMDYFITPIINSGLIITALMLLIWLWATYKMKTADSKLLDSPTS